QRRLAVLTRDREITAPRPYRVVIHCQDEVTLELNQLDRLTYLRPFRHPAISFDEGNDLLAACHWTLGLARSSSSRSASIPLAWACLLATSLASPFCARAWSASDLRIDRTSPAKPLQIVALGFATGVPRS